MGQEARGVSANGRMAETGMVYPLLRWKKPKVFKPALESTA